MIICRTPEVVHAAQLVVLCQCFGRAVPVINVIDLIIQMILAVPFHIRLRENTIIPSTACRVGKYSRRKCYPGDITKVTASAVPLFQRLFYGDLYHIRCILIRSVITIRFVSDRCILRRIAHCLRRKILRIFRFRCLNDLCFYIRRIDRRKRSGLGIAGVGICQHLGDIQLSAVIYYRLHAVSECIQECHAIQIPVTIVVCLKLNGRILVIFQSNSAGTVCDRMNLISVRIITVGITICTEIRVIRVGQIAVVCAVAAGRFVPDIFSLAQELCAGGKPCLLQVETRFTPDHRRVLCSIQCIPVGMVSISLMHCQPEPVAIDIVCLIFYRLRQLLQLFGSGDTGSRIVPYLLHILCSLRVLVQQHTVLTADIAACGRRAGDMGDGLIQKFPHIHLYILICAETDIMHQIIHIHQDIAVLYLLIVIIGIPCVGESARQHGVQIAIWRKRI